MVSRLWGRPTLPFAIAKQNTLAGLPLELLLSITRLLPLDDWICLALCNRGLYAIFDQRTNAARMSKRDNLPVLRRLERDLPNYFLCYVCYVLHRYDGTECIGLSGSRSEQKRWFLPCFVEMQKHRKDLRLKEYQAFAWRSEHNIYFLNVQLAMKRFYYGEKFGIGTEALSHTQAQTHPAKSSYPKITSLLSIDAQIYSKKPGLCLRKQHIMFVYGTRPDLLLSRCDANSIDEPPRVMFICAHVLSLKQAKLLDTAVNAHIDGKKSPRSTHKCKKCNTDYLIEVCGYGSDLALVLTTWVNLGTGLTPDEPRWKVLSVANQDEDMKLGLNDQKDSPRACFEKASPRPLEALRSCNLSYLKNQRFKQIMSQKRKAGGGQGIWYLPNTSLSEGCWLI